MDQRGEREARTILIAGRGCVTLDGMRGLALVGAVAGVIVLAMACGSESTTSTATGSNDSGASSEGAGDATSPAPDGGGVCCPPDPAPGCCMKYGGWAEDANRCFSQCDGMPAPFVPGWKLVDDEHGCKVWSEPSGGTKCGGPYPDAATDASDASDGD